MAEIVESDLHTSCTVIRAFLASKYKVTLLCSLEFTLTLHSHVVLCYTPPGFTLLINQTLMNEVCLEVIPFVSPNRVCRLLTLLLLLTFVYQTESVVFILCCYWCWTSSERVDASLLLSLVSQTQEAVGSKCSLISTGLGAGLGTLFTLKYVGVRTTSKTAALVRLELK